MRKDEREVTQFNHSAVVKAPGSLGKDAADRVRRLMMSCLNNGDTSLVLDMKAAPFIDSDGLRMLQDVLRQAETKDASVALANANDSVLRTLTITQMDRLFPIFTSVEEALRQHKS